MKTYVSVDMDFLNHVDDPKEVLAVLVKRIASDLTDVKIVTDHLPSIGFPGRNKWKEVYLVHYDEHDDYESGECENIGNWAQILHNKGAKILWVHPKDMGYRCITGGTYGDSFLPFSECSGVSDLYLPPDKIEKAAFFMSPGYLEDPTLAYDLFRLLNTNGMKANGKDAGNWTIEQIRSISQ